MESATIATRDVTIKISAQDNFSTVLQNYNRAMQEAADKTAHAGDRIGGIRTTIGGTIATFGSGISTLQNFAGAVQGFAQPLIDLANRGQQVSAIAQAFEALGGSANSLAQLQAVTGGIVSDMDLMRNSSMLMQMGLATSGDEVAKFTELAVKLGGAMGHDATKSMEDFALMLANQSIRRLDTFGISADSVKMRMKELKAANSEVTTQQAFLTATMEEGEKAMGRLGDAANAMQTPMNRAATSIENLRDRAAVAWADMVNDAITAGEQIGKILSMDISNLPVILDAIRSEVTGKPMSSMAIENNLTEKDIERVVERPEHLATAESRGKYFELEETQSMFKHYKAAMSEAQSQIDKGLIPAQERENATLKQYANLLSISSEQAAGEIAYLKDVEKWHNAVADARANAPKAPGVGDQSWRGDMRPTGVAPISEDLGFLNQLPSEFGLKGITDSTGNAQADLATLIGQEQEIIDLEAKRYNNANASRMFVAQNEARQADARALKAKQDQLDAIAAKEQRNANVADLHNKREMQEDNRAYYAKMAQDEAEAQRNEANANRMRALQDKAAEEDRRVRIERRNTIQRETDMQNQTLRGIGAIQQEKMLTSLNAVEKGGTRFGGNLLLDDKDNANLREAQNSAQALLQTATEMHEKGLIDDKQLQNAQDYADKIKNISDEAQKGAEALKNMSLAQLEGRQGGGRLGEGGDEVLAAIEKKHGRGSAAYKNAKAEFDKATGRVTEVSEAMDKIEAEAAKVGAKDPKKAIEMLKNAQAFLEESRKLGLSDSEIAKALPTATGYETKTRSKTVVVDDKDKMTATEAQEKGIKLEKDEEQIRKEVQEQAEKDLLEKYTPKAGDVALSSEQTVRDSEAFKSAVAAEVDKRMDTIFTDKTRVVSTTDATKTNLDPIAYANQLAAQKGQNGQWQMPGGGMWDPNAPQAAAAVPASLGEMGGATQEAAKNMEALTTATDTAQQSLDKLPVPVVLARDAVKDMNNYFSEIDGKKVKTEIEVKVTGIDDLMKVLDLVGGSGGLGDAVRKNGGKVPGNTGRTRANAS